jgi:hypothetical protein
MSTCVCVYNHVKALLSGRAVQRRYVTRRSPHMGACVLFKKRSVKLLTRGKIVHVYDKSSGVVYVYVCVCVRARVRAREPRPCVHGPQLVPIWRRPRVAGGRGVRGLCYVRKKAADPRRSIC